MGKALSDRQIRQFREDGFLSPVTFMDVDEARAFLERLETFEKERPDLVGKLDFKANLLLDWIDKLARREHVLDIIEDLVGPDILNWNATFRFKKPDGRAHAAWHQDSMYIKLKPFLVIAWLALSAASSKHGCLTVIPGSHKWKLLDHAESNDGDSILSRAQYITEEFDASGAVEAELKPGEACLFDHRIIHASGPNTSDERRVGLLIDYLPTSAQKEGPRDSAMLVRGHDGFGHFDLETPPTGEATPENLEQQRRALEMITATMYEGSTFTPKGLTGS
ncbi:MAG: phytanoyl-CoA dioxygenase family protein [Rhodospirillales bacterium]|nr:phytanoyl-CoA dioxygenase family protein [Rhodospirillales bacterium]MBO6785783.1 phytanoyl-CoA dioxygenase family protein [Rhodospirillales bacterium]